MGFPGGPVVRNPPANAGDTYLIPDPRRFHPPRSSYARAPQPLSLCSRAQELQLLSSPTATAEACKPLSPCSATGKPLQWQAHASQLESNPYSPQEKSLHGNKDPAEPKMNKCKMNVVANETTSFTSPTDRNLKDWQLPVLVETWGDGHSYTVCMYIVCVYIYRVYMYIYIVCLCVCVCVCV